MLNDLTFTIRSSADAFLANPKSECFGPKSLSAITLSRGNKKIFSSLLGQVQASHFKICKEWVFPVSVMARQ